MSIYLRRLMIAIGLTVVLLTMAVEVRAVDLENPIKAGTIPELIYLIVKIIFNLALWIAPLMIIIAGFYFVTAGGNPTQINNAKQLIMWTLIGLAVTFLARGIIEFFQDVFEI